MALKEKAKEVLKIIDEGGFYNPAGKWMDIKDEVDFSINNSKTYEPDAFPTLNAGIKNAAFPCEVSVVEESTQRAIQRLTEEGVEDLLVLNFASARNPGGGFLNGAKAQEEDLTRCSTLYSCLVPQTLYYSVNRQQSSMLYTDHIIYSPKVPWFRVRSRDAPDEVYIASVITAPAPNAGQARRRGVGEEDIEQTLKRRCGKVLAVARDNGHKNLVLGAWGCGVFGNDPAMVARAFGDWLKSEEFASAFEHVCFSIFDGSKEKSIYAAFATELAA